MSEKSSVDAAAENAILELKGGNKDALSIIYELYGRMIFSVALGITGNYSDAEDVLQDTMVETVKYSASYKPGTSPRAFVLAMARHKAMDILRQRRNYIEINDASLAHLESEDSLEDGERQISSQASKLLLRLDEDEKQIIIFRIYADMSYSEIAKAMKISIFAAQKRYQRAIKKLRDLRGEDIL